MKTFDIKIGHGGDSCRSDEKVFWDIAYISIVVIKNVLLQLFHKRHLQSDLFLASFTKLKSEHSVSLKSGNYAVK